MFHWVRSCSVLFLSTSICFRARWRICMHVPGLCSHFSRCCSLVGGRGDAHPRRTQPIHTVKVDHFYCLLGLSWFWPKKDPLHPLCLMQRLLHTCTLQHHLTHSDESVFLIFHLLTLKHVNKIWICSWYSFNCTLVRIKSNAVLTRSHPCRSMFTENCISKETCMFQKWTHVNYQLILNYTLKFFLWYPTWKK